jgi:general secretion pathway protein G
MEEMQKTRQPNRSASRVLRTRRRNSTTLSGSRGAFTLIEVLLVVAILGVIAAAVVPALIGRQQDANMQITKTDIKGLEQAMKMYAIDHDGEYLQGSKDALSQLTQSSEYRGKKIKPYLEELPKDAWGEPLNYEYPSSKAGEKPAIWSSGPNRQNEEGGGDDINNWSEK